MDDQSKWAREPQPIELAEPFRCLKEDRDTIGVHLRAPRRRFFARTTLTAGLASLMLAFSVGVQAHAGTASARVAPISGELSTLSDAELETRVDFLRSRFEAGERYARLWQRSFTGAWAAGAVLGSVQAGLTSKSRNRVSPIVTASKAVIGTTRLLLDPHPARLGSRPLDVSAKDPRGKLEAMVLAGEEHLLEIEHKAQGRRNWIAHAANVGLNALGGGLIIGLGKPTDAIQSVGVGVVFGELMLWSAPKRGEQDLRDYRSVVRNGALTPKSPDPRVSFAPTTNGVFLQIQF